jgi:hypothetical protein
MYSTLFILREASSKQMIARQFTTGISNQHGQIQRIHLQLINELKRQNLDKTIRDLEIRVEKLEKTMLELRAPKTPIPYVKREMSVLVIPDIFLEIPKG